MGGSGSEPGKFAEDEPSLNTPLDGGEGSLDTMTDIVHVEARVVEHFDPTALCSDVKQINTAVISLAGSVKAALLKFESVDARLEEFQTIQAGMQANMGRVEKYLSMVEKPDVTTAHHKFVSQSKGSASSAVMKAKVTASEPKGCSQSKGKSASGAGIRSKRTSSSAGNNKRMRTRVVAEIMENDILNVDFDGADLETDEGSSAAIQTQVSDVAVAARAENLCTPETPKNTKNTPFLTPWLQKSFRSATSVEGVIGAFVRKDVEETKQKLFRSPSSAKKPPSSFLTTLPASKVINPVTQARLYIRPSPAPIFPKSANLKFNIPSEFDWGHFEAQAAVYLFHKDQDPEEVVLSMDSHEARRKDFDCLVPGQQITDKIFNLIAVKIAREQSYLLNDTIWCIPPSFVDDVYKGVSIEKLARAYFIPFMSPWNTLSFIYVPMKSESGHWYLMVISIVDYAICYFDSHLNVDDVPIRCASMRTMCDTLMQMMSTSGRYVEMDFFRKMSDFHSWQLKEARGIPNTGSCHDSAVWVLNWLEMGAGFSPNHSGYPNDCAVRMKTGTSLLSGDHNDMRRVFEEKASLLWTSLHVADID